jgi:hypothetical protein
MMPDLLRDPLALRQEYFADNLQNGWSGPKILE